MKLEDWKALGKADAAQKARGIVEVDLVSIAEDIQLAAGLDAFEAYCEGAGI